MRPELLLVAGIWQQYHDVTEYQGLDLTRQALPYASLFANTTDTVRRARLSCSVEQLSHAINL